MKHEYVNLIRELDGALSMLRQGWLDAVAADKPKWMAKLDSMLDERFRLMKLRDGS